MESLESESAKWLAWPRESRGRDFSPRLVRECSQPLRTRAAGSDCALGGSHRDPCGRNWSPTSASWARRQRPAPLQAQQPTAWEVGPHVSQPNFSWCNRQEPPLRAPAYVQVQEQNNWYCFRSASVGVVCDPGQITPTEFLGAGPATGKRDIPKH